MYEKCSRFLHIQQEPRIQLIQYLKLYIQTIQANLDLIILWLNLNGTIQRHNHKVIIGEIYFYEVIISINTGTSLPVTNWINKSHYPINSMWCSIGVKDKKVE